MKNDKSIDRLTFLAEKFDVFDVSEVKEKIESLETDGNTVQPIGDSYDNLLALVYHKEEEVDVVRSNELSVAVHTQSKFNVSICFDVFNNMVISDPSENKMYTQWMLNMFQRYLKKNELEEALRFVTEDLPLAKGYLEVFEGNKRKKKFKELTKNSFVLKGVKDPTNINQYKSLSQLYDAVDPFIDKDSSSMEKLMNGFVASGKAEIPVRDRRFTLYIPKCEEASLIFGEFAGWCTAKKDGKMFEFYRGGGKYRKPNGEKSDIYIVIDNKFFTGALKSDSLYQLHFESGQVRDRIQSDKNEFFEKVILKSEGIANFIHEELTNMAKMKNNNASNMNSDNVYIDYLIKFGWTEALFDIIEEYSPIIRFTNRDVPRLPDVSRFKNLTTFIIKKAKLAELHPSIGKLESLQELLIPDNNITVIPREIGMLKNLVFINLLGNKIKTIHEDIKYLDKSNGGSLHRIAFNVDEIGEANHKLLKRLLPSTMM